MTFLAASAAAYWFYSIFYYFSPFIWESYTKLPMHEVTTWSRWSLQGHDGIEVFVLYPLVLLVIFTSGVLYAALARKTSVILKVLFFVVAAASAFFYYRAIGFCPPQVDAKLDLYGGVFICAVILLALLLDKGVGKFRFLRIMAAIVIFLVCLIPVQWFVSGFDYLFIFTPALRTLHGFDLRETYFQYDYFLSLLVMAWMKLKLDLGLFHLLGNFSFFALIAGIYCFGRKHFMYKGLAAYLAVAILISRIYGDTCSIGIFPQTTPLRLDWWFVLLVLGFWKGYRHWVMGLGLGLLVIFHHAFGTIYALSYGVLMAVLFMVDILERKQTILGVVKQYFGGYGLNLLLIIGSFIVYQFFLTPVSGMAALTYQKYNVAFLPVSRMSFYWYILVMLSGAWVLLLKHRAGLEDRYFQTTLFLIALAAGNSFYFFGRSDEVNIIKISAVLLVVIFALLDLLHFDLKRSWHSKVVGMAVPAMAVMLIAAIALAYSGRAVVRLGEQVTAALKGPYKKILVRPLLDLPVIKAATQGSTKLIILSIVNDFQYYYELGISPQGYYCFTNAWFLKKEYIAFLNQKLDDGYYLVMPGVELPAFIEILSELAAHKAFRAANYVIMKK